MRAKEDLWVAKDGGSHFLFSSHELKAKIEMQVPVTKGTMTGPLAVFKLEISLTLLNDLRQLRVAERFDGKGQ